ncbi:MAG: hypothetical protein G01um101438_603 [Parcubacteria group bacterium Gr01-1014_38]|nr:MAG: hypothetical protein G01um101438_603 [Parcubacteria group bacterium Gr01-1014_38]
MNPLALGALLFFLLFLAFYAIWSVFLAYHLLRFAPRRETAIVSIILFVGVTLFLLLVSVAGFLRLDWSAPTTLPTAVF